MPPRGCISILPMNLNDFKGLKCLLGESYNMEMFTEDVVCVDDAESSGA